MPRSRFPDTSEALLATLAGETRDFESWSRFVMLYGPRVLRWCRGAGLQDADAHDVTQVVLLRFLKRVGTFDYDRSRRFRGWLRAMTRSTIRDFMKSGKRWDRGLGGGDDRIEQAAGRDEIDALIETEDARESLRGAAERVRARVEPRTWEAFRLLNVEGVPGEQAAERVGMRLGSTYAASAKVRRMIREELEGRAGPNP